MSARTDLGRGFVRPGHRLPPKPEPFSLFDWLEKPSRWMTIAAIAVLLGDILYHASQCGTIKWP